MLDKVITYIVCWYKTLYQVLSVAWTNRITIATRSDTGSHNRLDLIQSLVPPHYVCNGYILMILQYMILYWWYYNIWYYIDDITIYDTILMILKSEKMLKTHKIKNKKTTLNNRLKNQTVITIISQFTICLLCFYFLLGILLLKQGN